MRTGWSKAENSSSAESRFRMSADSTGIPMQTCSCHAIADALLGAISEGDIGQHFPNTDEGIRGISSLEILRQVRSLLAEKNARAINIDATVIAEAPRLQPHIQQCERRSRQR